MPPPKQHAYATLTSWSFSVYQQWVRCAWSVCLEKVQRVRVVEPPNPVFIKGNRSHAIAEQFIGGKGRKRPDLVEILPPAVPGGAPIKIDLSKIKEHLVDLRTRKADVEREWAFDRQWNPCDWKDWNRAWLRVKTDVCAHTEAPPHVDIVDWKTGKPHDEHRQQRSLYALGGLQLVQLGLLAGGSKDATLTARHIYMDWPECKATEEFKFKDLPALKREWLARVKPMMEDTTYRANPGYACRYCKFAPANGGPCEKGK